MREHMYTMNDVRETGENKVRPVWSSSPEEVLGMLGSEKNGLTEDEIAARRERTGKNVIASEERIGKGTIFIRQFKSPLIIILIIAALITLKMEGVADALFIMAAVLVNVFLGFYQENKAETALLGLRSYIKERVRVIRDGREGEIDAEDLVPGDIVRIAQGARVPADGRVLYENQLTVDEAILTGESLPKTKGVEPDAEDTALADMRSMLFGGTLVAGGTGSMVVTATGTDTELGKIAKLVAEGHGQATPLQRAIAAFTKKALYVLGVLIVLLFVLGLASGYAPFDMFLISVAVAVASVPEGLPIALTVILTVGVERLAKKKGVVRKLLAAETLGSTTLIITDKTGTLTQAKMRLAGILSSGPKEKVLETALLNTDVIIENPDDDPEEWRIIGNALEAGIVRAAGAHQMLLSHIYEIVDPKRNENIEILDRKPFNSFDKFSANYVRLGTQKFWSYLGAPERIIEKTTLDDRQKKKVLQEVNILAEGGHRVLAVARDGSYLGLLAFRDPLRPDIRATLDKVERAGIRTVIATGDHAGTARAVGTEIGLLDANDTGVITGTELRGLADEELERILPGIKVFARVTPEDKLRIARLYQKCGEVVAMTGDGVNDAPALKAADIGIAVGSGTDVAKGAADLVMLDDNFEIIVSAIEEGRRAVNNIKKVIVYLLSDALNSLILIGASIAIGVAAPLTALQILWVNFFSDSFPAVAFAFERGGDEMKKKPGEIAATGIFDKEMKFLILIIGIAMSVLLFALYLILLSFGHDEMLTRTFIFGAFGLSTLFVAFSVKNLEKNIFHYNVLSNPYLIGGTAIGFVLMVAGIYAPPLQGLLDTVALPPLWFCGVLGVGAINMAAIEAGKYLFVRKKE